MGKILIQSLIPESLIISNKIRIEKHPPIYLDGRGINKVAHHKRIGIILRFIWEQT